MPRLRVFLAAVLTVGAALSSVPVEAKDTACPPGLAKKAVPCVPPGQVGKSWKRGDHIDGVYVLIPRGEWDHMALHDYHDGSGYLQINNQILRVALDTLIVIEAVRILELILD